MKNFTDLGLPAFLVKSLEQMKITQPTPIQAATIPAALNAKDILASAQTGSGKTIAYAIPLLIQLISDKKATGLILAPTRELALQVQTMLHQILGPQGGFRTALLIGGAPISKQIRDLKRLPQLIIGTPGRINDHLQQGTLSLSQTKFLVIDEADRMLDMGFGVQLDKIAGYLPEQRQTLMFSATFPPNIEKLSKKYLRNPERIEITAEAQAAPKIKQESLFVKGTEKAATLLQQIEARQGSMIVFVRTRRSADRISRDLFQQGHASDAIHGDLQQRRREKVLHRFRSGKTRILVATDVAARGLDIPHVMHVINFDLPECPEDYIHRIGRTGRAGAEGNAICFITSQDGDKWRAICKLIDPQSVPPKTPHHPSPKHHKKRRFGRRRSFRR